MTKEQRMKALTDTRRARLEGRPEPRHLQFGSKANERGHKAVHQIKGGNSRVSPGNYKPTAKQISFVRTLEAETDSHEADLTDMSRIEISDYITILRHRVVKQQLKQQLSKGL